MKPEQKYARVQPGIVLDELRKAAGKHGLTFGPIPRHTAGTRWGYDRQQILRDSLDDGR